MGKWITLRLYVDDVILISRWLCVDCLMTLPKQDYKHHIKFDLAATSFPSKSGDIIIKYLDSYINILPDKINVFHYNPNLLHLWTLGSLERLKHRAQPCIWSRSETRARTVSDRQGRVSRLHQLRFGLHAYRYCVTLRFVELLQNGYP